MMPAYTRPQSGSNVIEDNEDAIAVDKLSDGIRKLAVDLIKLEKSIASKI